MMALIFFLACSSGILKLVQSGLNNGFFPKVGLGVRLSPVTADKGLKLLLIETSCESLIKSFLLL